MIQMCLVCLKCVEVLRNGANMSLVKQNMRLILGTLLLLNTSALAHDIEHHLDAPGGALELTETHEAAHVAAVKNIGLAVTRAVISHLSDRVNSTCGKMALGALLAVNTAVFSSESERRLNAPIGTLEFAAIHEAGHVVAAKGMGLSVTRAVVFKRSGRGGGYWKGTTTFRASSRSSGIALVKLGGNYAEFFIDESRRVRTPQMMQVIGNRNVISETDVITKADLAGESLSNVQHRTYRLLCQNVLLLSRVYNQLLTEHHYP